jgi:hypothetical protein
MSATCRACTQNNLKRLVHIWMDVCGECQVSNLCTLRMYTAKAVILHDCAAAAAAAVMLLLTDDADPAGGGGPHQQCYAARGAAGPSQRAKGIPCAIRPAARVMLHMFSCMCCLL